MATSHRRDAWTYGLAFAAIVGGGLFLVLPRLMERPAERPPAERPAPSEVPPTPPTTPPRVPEWVEVLVEGEGGSLRGALRPVAGAESEVLDGPESPTRRVRVRAAEARVKFGAAGHLWTEVDADDLRPGKHVRLPLAAAPTQVRVVEPDGRPAAGVPVRTLPETPVGVRRTDASGVVAIDDVPVGLLLVDVGGDDRAGPTLRLRAGTEREATATLDHAWRVRGRVVAEGGRPVSGARVQVVSARGTIGTETATDSAGRFEWTGPAEGVASLSVRAPGLGDRSFEIEPPDAAELASDLGDLRVGGTGATVRGRVVSRTGLAGASVTAEPAVAAFLREVFGPEEALVIPRRASVGPDGSFELEGLSPEFPWRLSVRGAGLPYDEIVRLSPGEVRVLEAVVPEGTVFRGRVEDRVTSGQVAGLVVLASRVPVEGDRELPGDRVATTDADGRFAFAGLSPGPLYLRAYASGRRSLLERVELPVLSELGFALEPAVVDAARRVEGTVVSEDGAPLAGVTVRAGGIVAVTDAAGSFRLDGVESLVPHVTLAYGYDPGTGAGPVDPRSFASERREIRPGGPPLKLVLLRGASIRLRALDGIDDRPLAWVRIVLHGDDGVTVVDRTVAPRDGQVLLEGLPPRGARLALLAPGRRLVLNVALTSGLAKDLGDLRLPHGLTVRGRVVDEAGKGIAAARVAVLGAGWLLERTGDPTDRRDLSLRRAVTGIDGSFVLDGLDPTRPTLVGAWAAGLAPGAARIPTPEFRTGNEANVEVRLRPGGTLRLVLHESGSNEPVAGGVPDLEDARTGADYLDLLDHGVLQGEAGSTEDWARASDVLLFEGATPGTYRVGPVEPGPYDLRIEHPFYRSERRRLTILPPSDRIVGIGEGDEAGTITVIVEMNPR